MGYTIEIGVDSQIGDPDISSDDPKDHIGDYEHLAYLVAKQKVVAAISCLVTAIMLLSFVQFSKQLSLMTNVLRSAKYDIVFFLLMFAFILVGFSVSGCFLLGHYDLSFDQVYTAIVTNYHMLLGEYDYHQIILADSVMGGIYFALYMFIFNIVLLNMFIAIISSHYESVKKETGDEKPMGAFKRILLIIKRRRDGQKHIIQQNQFQRQKSTRSAHPNMEDDELPIYEIPALSYQRTNPNIWLKNFYQALGYNAPELANFNIESEEVEQDLIQPLYLDQTELAFMRDEEWTDADVGQKVALWRGLQEVHNNFLLTNEGRRMLRPGEKDLDDISKIQKHFWQLTSLEERFELWNGKISFNNLERKNAWNQITYNPEYFDDLNNLPAQYDFWSKLSLIQKTNIVNKLFEKHARVIKLIQQKGTTWENVSKYPEFIEDQKFMFWCCLNISQRCEILLNQNNEIEADIMANLLLYESRNNVLVAKQCDQKMDYLLNVESMKKVNELAHWISEWHNCNELESEVRQDRALANELEEYAEALVSLRQQQKNAREVLKGQLAALTKSKRKGKNSSDQQYVLNQKIGHKCGIGPQLSTC